MGSEGAETKTKMLYAFMFHMNGGPYSHTLYALPIPNADEEDFTEEPERLPVSPLISFPTEDYPIFMACVKFGDSQLYFMGGLLNRYDDDDDLGVYVEEYPADVHILDLTSPAVSAAAANPSEILMKAPPMHSGKLHPVAFAFEGKIYVVSSHTRVPGTDTQLHPCEYFDGTQWHAFDNPPIDETIIFCHEIVGRAAYFPCDRDGLYCRLSLDDLSWKLVKNIGFTFGYQLCQLPSEDDDNTLYISDRATRVMSAKCSDSPDVESGGVVLTGMKQLDVVKNQIGLKRPSAYLTYLGDKRFGYLQVASPRPKPGNDFIGFMNMSIFDVSGDEPKPLRRAHFSTILPRCPLVLNSAHASRSIQVYALLC